MRLVKKVLYCCPYCMSYVYAGESMYLCDVCDRLFDKVTLEEVNDE